MRKTARKPAGHRVPRSARGVSRREDLISASRGGLLLQRAGEDYSELIKALKGYPDWWHCLDSTWLIESNSTAADIRDYLWKFMHPKNDKLLVMYYLHSSTGGSASWKGFKDSCATWLKTNL